MARKQYKLHVPTPDHAALFVQAARRIALNAGMLDAYRRGCGLVFRKVRTPEAARTLAAAVGWNDYGATIPEAAEAAGRKAMCAFVGQWWTCELSTAPPDALAPGDEWFSRQTVRAVVEEFAEAVADAKG